MINSAEQKDFRIENLLNPAAAYRSYASGNPELTFLAGLLELRNVTYVDLPTSHWPMWSKPQELAAIIGDVARACASEG